MTKALFVAAAGMALIAAPAPVLADHHAGAIVEAVADPARPEADVARDAARKPAEIVAFAGVEPGMKIAEIAPGGGYYTRILSKAVGPQGKVYALMPAFFANRPGGLDGINALAEEYGNIEVVVIDYAATRLPEVPLYDGVEHPGGTVLLLHATCMADTAEEARALLGGLGECPVEGRELGHVTGPTSVAEESVAQMDQNPDGYRYAVDCAWTDASADVLAPLLLDIWRELDTEHSFSIWYGWAPTRELPDMAFSIEGNVYVATYLIYPDAEDDARYRARVHDRTAAIARDGGVGVYLGDTDFTGRQDRFLTPEHYARLEEIRARRDPDGRIAGYLCADREGLNVHA